MNVAVLARPDGTALWFPRALPGRTHGLTAARAHGVMQACLTRKILVLADRAYRGAGATACTPYYSRHLPEQYAQQFTRHHAQLRAPGQRAFTRLKQWRIFRKAAAARTGSAGPSPPFTPSRPPGDQDEKG